MSHSYVIGLIVPQNLKNAKHFCVFYIIFFIFLFFSYKFCTFVSFPIHFVGYFLSYFADFSFVYTYTVYKNPKIYQKLDFGILKFWKFFLIFYPTFTHGFSCSCLFSDFDDLKISNNPNINAAVIERLIGNAIMIV